MNDKLLLALSGKNRGAPPVWLMRQAGRYMPNYQALRKKHSLLEMFFTTELIVQTTLLPVEELNVDAAILFSDITTLAKGLGFALDFADGVGPVLEPLLQDVKQIERLLPLDLDALSPIFEAIRLLKQQLTVPLIGFCGAPFTVATYLIEKKHGGDVPLTKRLCYQDPASMHRLLDHLTVASCSYLDRQIDQGADVIQLFDSWAHVLSLPLLHEFCLPYHERLVRHVQKRSVPVISFLRAATLHPEEVAAMQPDAISFDWQRPLASMRSKLGSRITLQGNLDPDLLFASLPVIEDESVKLLDSMKDDPAFIFNLGHGIKPHTPWHAVRHLVDVVHR